ncbi:hypothetical protein EIN_246950 [Entamoeba invadens IP1]|uniref:Uncharacterized protein n=1 Tax=Entamoeba invadens IP1 TaxID=370355 RepID=A0A0A1UDW9_ENTIV|nr:hypothetical protein EIN_246950 [Entamoeba invadens IP1]ELP94801.1 hypothetical protein EIN_246950 [Entamoeba invadens IP1]|eukprot:XP_004261572.1 hypothetical protein EIN_246950 [Entamoeba invadens IP1]
MIDRSQLLVYLAISSGFYLLSSCVLLIDSSLGLAKIPQAYDLDGSLLLKNQVTFYRNVIIMNALITFLYLFTLCFFKIRWSKIFYWAIYLVGFICLSTVFFVSFSGFTDIKKVQNMTSEQKRYNEKRNECCFYGDETALCNCHIVDKNCPTCDFSFKDLYFFVSFCSNAICVVALFSCLCIIIAFYYKTLKEKAKEHNQTIYQMMNEKAYNLFHNKSLAESENNTEKEALV